MKGKIFHERTILFFKIINCFLIKKSGRYSITTVLFAKNFFEFFRLTHLTSGNHANSEGMVFAGL